MAAQHGFVERLAELSAEKQPFVCVTIVDVQGSVPQEAGSKMIVNAHGVVFGTIGGGRVEHQATEVAQQILNDTASTQRTRLVNWNLKRDVGMTCGGTLTLYFESYFHRVWSIAIFGAGHVANALSRCLINLDCQLTVIDPRGEWLGKLPANDRLTKVQIDAPELYVDELKPDSYVLLMTMGHRTDKPILERILKSSIDLPYLGVIGSKAKRAVLAKELLAAGLAPSDVERFRCPIGLPLGNNEPNEIAISITAELLQVRDEIQAERREPSGE
jgi:xanthine dehydrogenase accessory factor